MLDRWAAAAVKPILRQVALRCIQHRITPNQITVFGFVIGMSALPALIFHQYFLAGILIAVNRILDGLDGAVARIAGTTDLGGFLDITLDFIFYAVIIMGFAIADPDKNALAAAVLLCGFMATSSSFLSYATIAAKRGIEDTDYGNKSLYYLGGLTEGTETMLFFFTMTLLPGWFPQLAFFFASLCLITALTRIIVGVKAFST